jgi:hypothetical protein
MEGQTGHRTYMGMGKKLVGPEMLELCIHVISDGGLSKTFIWNCRLPGSIGQLLYSFTDAGYNAKVKSLEPAPNYLYKSINTRDYKPSLASISAISK